MNALEERHVRVEKRDCYRLYRSGSSLFSQRHPVIRDLLAGRPTLVVLDSNVHALYSPIIADYLQSSATSYHFIVLNSGEENKCMSAVLDVCAAATRMNLPRDGCILAIGGGVILDIAGLAASVFRRGVALLRVPTTLLAQVDAGLGIKNGVNTNQQKNALGAFYAPETILNDRSFLHTLTNLDMWCGISEIIKVAMMYDASLVCCLIEHGRRLFVTRFEQPKEHASGILDRAEDLMLDAIEADPFQNRGNRLVDFGHTVAHSLEVESRFAIPHGIAVAADMLLTTGVAVHRGVCDEGAWWTLVDLYRVFRMPLPNIGGDGETLLRWWEQSRLSIGGRARIAVPSQVGAGQLIETMTREDCEYALERYRQTVADDVRIYQA